MQLGFIGVGNIGTPMCRHLIEAGHQVLVFDVMPSNLARMVNLGAQQADSPKAVALACDIVFSSLPGPREIEQVALGNRRHRRCRPSGPDLRRPEHQLADRGTTPVRRPGRKGRDDAGRSGERRRGRRRGGLPRRHGGRRRRRFRDRPSPFSSTSAPTSSGLATAAAAAWPK